MKTLLILAFLYSYTICSTAQTIDTFSVDSGGASETVGNISILYTIGEVHIQELKVDQVQVSEGFINANFKIKIDPKLFLQGALLSPAVTGLMNDNLRASLLPTTSPYKDAATCDASVFTITGNNAIVDWVWVELRAAIDNTKVINGKSALLQRDGDVVGVDGVTNLLMNAAPSNYYVVVNHRNHLGAMSASTIGLSEDTATVVNFKSSSFPTFGNHAQITLASGDMALWAGNANGDNAVRYLGGGNDTNFIKDEVLNHPNNPSGVNLIPFSGYNNADINLDGTVRYLGANNDTNMIKDIILNHPNNGSGSNLFLLLSQIPN
ncbi:hemagglutinin protein [Lacinutrix sp. WUR7]|uniref:hemagglutinin protein n=1 Tax=Lacinutrix sp. WUR7 TaxID=2653681 RepID=UPI00193E084B|nr:hemagglutinin protein [Lacinutrix sp. WUR7]QRM90756.1 hemagglutinin protein [Lacinutrix sp. WUR7]